jgi:hypothetical protein
MVTEMVTEMITKGQVAVIRPGCPFRTRLVDFGVIAFAISGTSTLSICVLSPVALRVPVLTTPVRLRIMNRPPGFSSTATLNAARAISVIAALAAAASVTAATAMVGGEKSTKRADIDLADH